MGDKIAMMLIRAAIRTATYRTIREAPIRVSWWIIAAAVFYVIEMKLRG